MKNIKEIKAILEEKKEVSTRWIYVVTFEDGSKKVIGSSNAFSSVEGDYRPHFSVAVVNETSRRGFKLSHKGSGIEITS